MIHVGWSGVVVDGLWIPAPSGWTRACRRDTLDNPEFSLGEALSTRLAYSLAETVGAWHQRSAWERSGRSAGRRRARQPRDVSEILRDLFADERQR